jgi:type IV pilus assembly protein PilQ
MTVTNVRNRQPTRPAIPVHALALGLFAGLLSASASAGAPGLHGHAASLAMAQVAGSIDPAKQVPAAVTVSAVDFKRGDGGAGKLILRFDGEGASPDLRLSLIHISEPTRRS